MATTLKLNLRGFSIIDHVPENWKQMDTNKINLSAGNIFSQIFSAIGNLISSFNDLLPPPELIHYWLQVAAPYLKAAVLLIFCICCFPCFITIFRCLFGCISTTVVCLYRGILFIIRCLFQTVFVFLKQCLCSGGRSAVVMMKAPGMAGVMIARAVFEANTRAYFAGVRALS